MLKVIGIRYQKPNSKPSHVSKILDNDNIGYKQAKKEILSIQI